jgi:hypothetical protein
MAWTMAAATGLLCAVLAASAAWVLLTEPFAVASAVDTPALQSVVHTLVIAALKVAKLANVLRLP